MRYITTAIFLLIDYRKLAKEDKNYAVLLQNQQLLKYLECKPLEAIFDLYKPGNFVENIDTFTEATVKSSKVLSSIKDGLNRGIYTQTTTLTSAPKENLPKTGQLPIMVFLVSGLAISITGMKFLKKS